MCTHQNRNYLANFRFFAVRFRVVVGPLARFAGVELVVHARLLLFALERLPAAGLRRCDDNDEDIDDRRVVFVVDVPRRPVEVARVLDRRPLFRLFDNPAGLPARDDDADDRRLVLVEGLVRLMRVLHLSLIHI